MTQVTDHGGSVNARRAEIRVHDPNSSPGSPLRQCPGRSPVLTSATSLGGDRLLFGQ
ncbi:hypothetical protein HMPREF0043_01304 [Actinobaculum sp. oral taxon 183 str. F0552]|nr:hypothetical protein HMPREF0043_01304 [Actinobaculum sp. oral taxon 183 str. F0552]